MKIKIETEIFDDDKYCADDDTYCDFLELEYCCLYNLYLATDDNYNELKCDRCKKAYQEAKR